MLNRADAPQIQLDSPIQLAPYQKQQLGQLPVYAIGGAIQEISKIELVYPAGKWNEPQKGVAHFAAKLLKEGTQQRDAQAIAEQLDFWGASLSVESSADYWTLTAYCLTKHLEGMLVLIRELLEKATFPEEELALKKHLQKQKLKVNLQKVEVQATRKLMASLFGADHFYGYRLSEEDISAINRDEILSFYQQKIAGQPFWLFVSGHVPQHFISIWQDIWPASAQLPAPQLRSFDALPTMLQPGAHLVPMPKAQQSALRIGRTMPHHTHRDYHGLKVLNTILGGYFGSRLMTNIREDKGFTYGIYSVLHAYAQQGIFYISTEVGAAHEEAALAEIFKELERLREEPIGAEELTLVRNYLLGNIMGGIDGPMKAANTLKGLVLQGQDEEALAKFIETIRTIQPKTLQALAQQYWQQNHMTIVVAGPN